MIIIIVTPLIVDCEYTTFLKIFFLSFIYIFIEYLDVSVPVRPSLFVPNRAKDKLHDQENVASSSPLDWQQ